MGDGATAAMIQSDQPIAQVCVVARSAEGAVRIGCELRSVLADQARVVELSTDALDQARPDAGWPTCAAVITLQNAALRRGAYVEFLQTCIDQVSRRDEFRLYLLLDDVSAEQIRHSRPTSDDPAEQVLARLMDTVQF